MADRLSAYADWLVANQNKRGTPEFDTVANAYRQLRQGTPDNSVFTGMKDRALRIGQGLVDLPQTALDAMTGMEDTRLLVGNNEPGFQMSDLVPRFASAEQADAMGYTENPLGFDGYEFKEAADYLERSADALNYQPAIPWDQVKQDPSPKNILGFMGETALTSLPDMAAALLSSPVYFASYIAPIANERAANDGGRAVTPADLAFASVAAATIAQAEKVGAKAIFGKQAGQTVKGRIGKAAGKEAATEAIQNPVEYAGGTVGTQAGFDPAVAADQALAGIVGGGGSGAGLRGTVEVAGGTARLFGAGDNTPTDPEGAADLARRLQSIATENNLDLNDIDKTSTKGAREAVDKAHVQLAEELKQMGRDLRQRLGITDTDELSVVLDKVLAAAGQREARNKTKNTVGKQEFDAIERLTGDTAEGQQMLRLMRQMNELTELHNSGYQGGVSRITDQFMPFGTNIGYDRGAIATERLLRPLVSGGAAIQTGGASLVGQTALAGAGRAIDAVTGRRSRVKRFIQQNAAKPGVQTDPSATSLRDERKQQVLAAQQQAAQDQQRRDAARARTRAMHKDILNSNTEYPQGSPQQIMVNELGLSPQQLIRALKSIVTDPTYGPAARSAIRSLQRGGRIQNVGLLIKRLQREMAKTTPPATRDRPIIQGQLAVYEAQEQQRSAAVAQGIRDNQALNDQLQAALEADATVSEGDRQIAKSTLEKLRMDLTRAPLETAEAYLQDALNRASDPGVITKYVLPYVERVRVQQNARAASEAPTAIEGMSAEPEINQMAVPDFGEGLSIFPKTRKLFRAIDSMDVPEGQYVADGENVTGQTYNGARVYIGPNGRPKMEVDPDQVGEPTKQLGKRWYSNAVRPDRYKMVENPTGHEGSIVAVEDSSKHYFAVQYEADVPTELYRKPLKKDGTEAQQPTMRPRGFGIIKPGNEIGKIKIAGRVHPLYDTIRIEPEAEPEINQMSGGPALFNYNVFDIPESDYAKTNLDVRPTPEQVKEMREGTFKPEKKRTLVEAAQHLQDRYEGSEADVQPLELTEENLERIAAMMATEAVYNLEQDGNAIGWYDRKLKAAKQVVAIVEPRVLQSPEAEQAFDFALAVTSNGQAVADNFEYALEVFRYFMDNGVMPTTTFIKGGERNASMVAAFDFFNQWNASGQNMSVGQFLDNDYTVRALIDFIDAFNEENGTDISVPSSEGMNEVVKGSYILGPKIGQGFYQNIRGNYDPLTMDIWWMRMWNRLTGRPFEDTKDEATMQKNRDKIERGMKETTDPAMKQVIKEALQAAGVKRTGLYKDPAKFDEFIVQLDKAYQRFYKRYKQENGVNHTKPALFKATGTHVKNMQQQLQAQPKGPGERSAMRRATKRAIELLQSQGYDINTADFQALMWYPEKQLFRLLGVAPGRGADNDYLDAAKLLAEKEGKTYEQIQEALPAAERDGGDSGTGAVEQDGQADRGSGSLDAGILNYNQPIDFDGAGDNGQLGRAPGLADSPVAGSREPTPTEVEQASRTVKAVFEIGKPGAEFENGVPDINTAKKIAEAINVAVHIAGTPATTAKHLSKKLGIYISPSRVKQTAGYKVASEPGPTPSGRGIGINTKEIPGKSPGYALYVMLHELGHVFETSPADPNDTAATYENVGNEVYSPTAKKVIPIDGFGDTFTGTFRDVLRQVLNVSGGEKADLKISKKDAEDIISEIINVQRTGVLQGDERRYLMKPPGQASIEKAPNQFEADFTNVRTDYYLGQKLVKKGALTQSEVDSTLGGAERTYFHTPHELAADLLGLYMLDPAGARAMMPKATRLAQIVFRDNPTIQFFSLPFASIVAMVLANMLVAEGEEEDMDPGVLSMGAGALTA